MLFVLQCFVALFLAAFSIAAFKMTLETYETDKMRAFAFAFWFLVGMYLLFVMAVKIMAFIS